MTVFRHSFGDCQELSFSLSAQSRILAWGIDLVASERTRRVTMIHLSSGWVAQGAGGSSQADQLHDHAMRLHGRKTSQSIPTLREPATSFDLEIRGQEAGAMF